ncbi:calponin homology domain-containing protein [Phlyctochytrium arcticum]|nr:calponin homology domain-containing protein [Phlyctochytrium arcticum]
MSSNVPIYGLDKELAAKAAAKYDPHREKEAREWVESITKEKVVGETLQDGLRDGVLLCKLVNALTPSQPIKFNTSKMPFKQMENINSFLSALSSTFHVPPSDQFQTIDLFENKNPMQVIDTLFALSRHAAKIGALKDTQPQLGPKLADKHEVQFTDAQLAEGKNIIGLQMGFAGGASQAGMGGYGNRRQVAEVAATQIVPGADPGAVSQQMGFAGGANAAGVSYGARREIGGQDPKKHGS